MIILVGHNELQFQLFPLRRKKVKIIDVISSVLPIGTVSPDHVSWDRCPIWPPDLFAAVATVIDRSGCYTMSSSIGQAQKARNTYLRRVRKAAKDWVDPFLPPPGVEALWLKLIHKYGNLPLAKVCSDVKSREILLELFAIADEVCSGIGWTAGDDANVFAVMASSTLLRDYDGVLPKLPHLPYSLCALTPPEVAVVLPKTMTPTVGCTVRSLSHNLALLPGISQLKAQWILADGADAAKAVGDGQLPIRLLVVPYPFRVPEKSFTAAPQVISEKYGYFDLKQEWLLMEDGGEITGKQIVDELLLPLLNEARRECGAKAIHGICSGQVISDTTIGSFSAIFRS